MTQEKITLGQLESFLLKSADILRGKMDASEFIGLQLTDVCLWLYNRFLKNGEFHPAFTPLLERMFRRSVTNGIHLRGLEEHWRTFERNCPRSTNAIPRGCGV